MALCGKLKGGSAIANPATPFQMKGRKDSQDLVLSARGRSLNCDSCSCCADKLLLQAVHYVQQTVLAHSLTGALFLAFDGLVCLSALCPATSVGATLCITCYGRPHI